MGRNEDGVSQKALSAVAGSEQNWIDELIGEQMDGWVGGT